MNTLLPSTMHPSRPPTAVGWQRGGTGKGGIKIGKEKRMKFEIKHRFTGAILFTVETDLVICLLNRHEKSHYSH